MGRVMASVVLLVTVAAVGDAAAQDRQTTLSPAYRRARLRALLEQWEARLPVVRQQIDVSQAKVEELGPQIAPAKAMAETTQQQTRAARQKLDALIDDLTAEYGATRELDAAQKALDDAEAETARIRGELIATLADDAEYRARMTAADEAKAKLEGLNAGPDADPQQRLATVATVTAAQNAVSEYETRRLMGDERYAAAMKRVDEKRADLARVRTEVNRLVKEDVRVKLADRAVRDAQRATNEAGKRFAEVQGQYRLYAGRLQTAAAEQAQLEGAIVEAKRDLGEWDAAPR